MVSPRDAASAFRAADRPAAGAEAAVNREGQLDFREFVGYVVNLAILAFHRPPSDAPGGSSEVVAPPPPSATDDLVAVEETLRLFECASTDTRRLRARLAANARAAAHNARDTRGRYPDDGEEARRDRRDESRLERIRRRRVASRAGRCARTFVSSRTPRDETTRMWTRRDGPNSRRRRWTAGRSIPGRRGDFACA